jgi:hypothetical protein
MENKLPSNIPALIRLGIDCLKECEADPAIKINTGVWCRKGEVCLAGAVMAKRLDAESLFDEHYEVTPSTCKHGGLCTEDDRQALCELSDTAFRALCRMKNQNDLEEFRSILEGMARDLE